MLSGHQELERFLDKRTTLFYNGMRDIFRARYGRAKDEQNPIHAMADLIGHTMQLADLNGRKRVLMEFDKAKKPHFADDKTPISPLPFEEAIDNLVSRDPRLAQGAYEVSKLYSTQHVFALAKSVNQNITARIQKAIGDSMERGEGLPQFTKLWEEITPWTRAYGANVYRTNTNTAYSTGRFKQASDPDVSEIIPAMIFISMCLPTSRPWHCAADGMIAATTDDIWKTFRPPIGWQCLCGTNFVSRYELKRRGLIADDGSVIRFLPAGFSNAHPDDGFRVGVINEGWAA